MKKRFIGLLSGIISALSLAFIYDKYLKTKLNHQILKTKAIQFVSRKISPRDYHPTDRFFRENPLAILLLIVLASFLIFNGGLQNYLRFFQASMIQMKYTTEPFDGAVPPISKVPKWTELTVAERQYSYSQIPAKKLIPLPHYSVSDFQRGKTWKVNNERERNAYITYPVPNLGNYKLDGTEGTGSHTGLDIKVPVGTPVHSISRGVVVKAKNQTTGFGKHIVIMHINVPDPQNPAKKITLFSAYAHLSQIKVREGDQVQKGQIIGFSGASGMATAPHLHFQIDKADAPFHPYWPITWNDVVKNHLNSFYDAVRQGVNKNLAKKYTVHPMKLVYKNIAYTPTSTSKIVASAGQLEKEISRNNTNNSVNKPSYNHRSQNISLNRRKRVVRRKNSRGRRFRFKDTTTPKTNNHIRIATRRTNLGLKTLHASAPTTKTTKTASTRTVNTQQNTSAKNLSFQKYGQDEMWFEMTDRMFIPGTPKIIRLFAKNSVLTNSGVTLRTTSRNFVKITPDTIPSTSFKNGFVEIKLTTNSKTPFKLVAETAKQKITSPSLLAKSFSDIPSIGKDRIFAEFANKNKIITADSRGNFRPKGFLNRAEAVKAIIMANKIPLVPAKKEFNDVNRQAWFAKYVSTAVAQKLVSGYAGNLFKPAQNITKAEFLKMALTAKNITPHDTKFSPYRDVSADSWYEPYFSFARNNGLLTASSQGYVYPNKPITRLEAARIFYKLSQLK